jgi:hypothetical protein
MSNSFFQTFKQSIARIVADDQIIGAGFLVSDRHLLTCAHVVNASCGVAQAATEMPTGDVELDFPLLAMGQRITGKVVFWQPVNPSQLGEDLAVLEISPAKLPPLAQAARLVTNSEPWGHPFRIFGFPEHGENGIWASGVLREAQGSGWVQMEDVKAPGYAIVSGFSGAPVWDEALDGVAGIAVAADQDLNIKAAFMIPTSLILSTITMLKDSITGQEPKTTVPLTSFQEVKAQALKKRLGILYAQYTAAYNQKSINLNAFEQPILDEQIRQLEEEINSVELQLNKTLN